MSLRTEEIDLSKLNRLQGEALGLFCWSDEHPLCGVAGFVDWRVCGKLSRVLLDRFFLAEPAEVILVPVGGRFGPRRLFLFGLGASRDFTPARCTKVVRTAAEVIVRAGVSELILGAAASRKHPEREAAFVRTAFEALGDRLSRVLVEKRPLESAALRSG